MSMIPIHQFSINIGALGLGVLTLFVAIFFIMVIIAALRIHRLSRAMREVLSAVYEHMDHVGEEQLASDHLVYLWHMRSTLLSWVDEVYDIQPRVNEEWKQEQIERLLQESHLYERRLS